MVVSRKTGHYRNAVLVPAANHRRQLIPTVRYPQRRFDFHFFCCPSPTPTIYQTTAMSSAARSSENLPPRTLARVAREVKSLLSNPPDGIKLVTDPETGMPTSLDSLMVSTSHRVESSRVEWN